MAAGLATLLLAGLGAAVVWLRSGPGPRRADAPVTAGPTGPAVAAPTPNRETPVPRLPLDPADAEVLGGGRLLAAGRSTAAGPWRQLGDPAWPVTERPVYVARARLTGARRRVDADVAIALRAEHRLDRLTLRLLPAARALGPDTHLQLHVRRDGTPVAHRVDRNGARLHLSLRPPLRSGAATVVRVQLHYRLVDRANIADDGGPAGFGLLAWNPTASFLGHWLPLLTVDDGPMLPWGDVGAFPAAVWSLLIESDADLVTGGEESPCPPASAPPPCVWARGVALRDVSAVAYDRMVDRDTRVGPLRVRAAAAQAGRGLGAVLQLAAGAARVFSARFGPLAWDELDVAAVPLSSDGAGMEFPGLIVLDDDVVTRAVAGGSVLVIAHEVGHQWFHALVGNGSLSSPVVDESLAQYLGYLFVADTYGQAAAQDLAARAFRARYRHARAHGLKDEAPAQPLEAFAGSEAYLALTYARAPLGWLAAEQAAGRDAVTTFLASAVERWGLRFVSDDELLAFAAARAPEVAAALRRYWVDPAPVG